MKTYNEIYKLLMGAHLYGLQTETSDYDYKTLYLPRMTDLLLNRRQQNHREGTGGNRNADTNIENEMIPLQVFFYDFYKGQTYAVEFAFATLAEMNAAYRQRPHPYQRWLQELVNQFLNKDLDAMRSYAVGQAKMYGLKTERYTATKQALEVMRKAQKDSPGFAQLAVQDTPGVLEELLKIKYVEKIHLPIVKGGDVHVAALEINGKSFYYAAPWHQAIDSVQRTLDTYGNRVKSYDGNAADWKAMSHAIRICQEIRELCDVGSLHFPRVNAKELLEVKQGRMPKDVAMQWMEASFNAADAHMATTSRLQERTPQLDAEFEIWQIETLYYLYDL